MFKLVNKTFVSNLPFTLITGTVSLVKIMKWHVVKTWQLPTVDKWVWLRPGLYRVWCVAPFKFHIQRVQMYSKDHRTQICIFLFIDAREIVKLWVKWHCLTTLGKLLSEVHVLYFLLIYFLHEKGWMNVKLIEGTYV